MDNYFTSVPLARDLLAVKTTIVGTVRKNKREIPPIFVNIKERPVLSTMFGFCESMVLLSYKPKGNKNVLALSTMHTGDKIDAESGASVKPEIITFYNMTKGGVDVVDELKTLYSVSRFCCRWPLRIFFSMLDIGGINSQIIHKTNTDILQDRRIYLKQLSQELMKPHLVTRSSVPYLPISLRSRITQTLKIPETEPNAAAPDGAFCSFCPRRRNRKSRMRCQTCNCALCREHAKYSCPNCSEAGEREND